MTKTLFALTPFTFAVALLLMSSCSSTPSWLREPMYYESAGDPEQLLIKRFGTAAVIDSLNFYDENNPWSMDDEQALVIKDAEVLLMNAERVREGEFEVTYYTVSFTQCMGLKDAGAALRAKLDFYTEHPDIEEQEKVLPLDGPILTLREFGDSEKRVLRERRYMDQGPLTGLAYQVYRLAYACGA